MVRTAIVVLVLALGASSAHAQNASQRAMRLFEESREHYDAGRFDRAAELLEEAYRIQPDPTLLYNMARAYEGAGRLSEAVSTYERYLNDAGQVRDRGAIERRLATLREQIARTEELERRAREEQPASGEEEEATPAPPRNEAPAAPSGGVDPLPWIVLALGAAALGAGVGLGVVSEDSHAQAVAEPEHRRALELQQSAYDFASGANACFIAGGALALIGVIWGIVSLSSGSGQSTASAPNRFRIVF